MKVLPLPSRTGSKSDAQKGRNPLVWLSDLLILVLGILALLAVFQVGRCVERAEIRDVFLGNLSRPGLKAFHVEALKLFVVPLDKKGFIYSTEEHKGDK